MRENVQLTEAKSGDAPTLDIVRRQAIESNFTDTYKRDDFADLVARPDPNLSEWINSDDVLVLVAKSEMTPVAYGALELQTGTIKGLYTAENYQGEGHAERILQVFEKKVRKEGRDSITVHTSKNAVDFFAQYNYRKDGRTSAEAANIQLVTMKKSV